MFGHADQPSSNPLTQNHLHIRHQRDEVPAEGHTYCIYTRLSCVYAIRSWTVAVIDTNTLTPMAGIGENSKTHCLTPEAP